MTEVSSGVQWGTLLFTLFTILIIIVLVSLVIYFSRHLKEIKGLENRVRALEKRERNNDQL